MARRPGPSATLLSVTSPAYDVGRRAAELTGAALRAALSADADAWVAGLLGEPGEGVALVAVGGLGRRELAAGSDLDLVLLHSPARTDGPGLAERLWYAVWDAGVGLDHSVRTPDEALAVADGDLKAALGLLDLRHLAGDADLAERTRSRVYDQWRAAARRRLPELEAAGRERADRSGELAFLLEPDLKEARGGLRDALVPRQVAAAQVADPPGAALLRAQALLLDVRGALHAQAVAAGRRPSDRLALQDQDAVASTLGHPDADALMAGVVAAARDIAWAADATWRRVHAWAAPTRSGVLRRPPRREPLADGVVSQGREVVLARAADPAADPALTLRAALAAAESCLPLSAHTLDRLAAAPPPPTPWPRPVLDAFVALLGTGHAAVPVLETLDTAGLVDPLLPFWPRVRSRPQRNAFHRFTVDRHLLETAAEAAALTRHVARPDLLLLAGLLHDLGKGWPGEDHTDAGVRELPGQAARMGLDGTDTAVLVTLVRTHLLLAEAATTRDLADPATAAGTAAAVGSRETLQLLRALTEADSIATGPAMWSRWKAGLLDELVRRSSAVLHGEPPPPAPASTPAQEALLRGTGLGVTITTGAHDTEVAVAAPDARGLLAAVAGVLVLHRLDLRAVDARVERGTGLGRALVTARATPRFGGAPPHAELLAADLRRVLAGDDDLGRRLADREAAYPAPPRALLAPARVLWDDEASGSASVVELRAPDRLGLLAGVAAAIDAVGLELRAARAATLGLEAVDAFYVVEPGDRLVPPGPRRGEIARALLAAAAGTVPPLPAEPVLGQS